MVIKLCFFFKCICFSNSKNVLTIESAIYCDSNVIRKFYVIQTPASVLVLSCYFFNFTLLVIFYKIGESYCLNYTEDAKHKN